MVRYNISGTLKSVSVFLKAFNNLKALPTQVMLQKQVECLTTYMNDLRMYIREKFERVYDTYIIICVCLQFIVGRSMAFMIVCEFAEQCFTLNLYTFPSVRCNFSVPDPAAFYLSGIPAEYKSNHIYSHLSHSP